MNKNNDKTFLRDMPSLGDFTINADDPSNLNNKIYDEKETRKRLLNHARMVGCEKEMMILFAQADKSMRNCTNEKEKSDMGKLFVVSVYRLLGGGGELYIDGQLACKDS